MRSTTEPLYAGYRSASEVISHAGWLYFRLPLSLRRVDKILAACGLMSWHRRQPPRRSGRWRARSARRLPTRSAVGSPVQETDYSHRGLLRRAIDERLNVRLALTALTAARDNG